MLGQHYLFYLSSLLRYRAFGGLLVPESFQTLAFFPGLLVCIKFRCSIETIFMKVKFYINNALYFFFENNVQGDI